MKPTGESNSFVLPPALLAEVKAAADAEHRPVADVVQAAIEGYVREKRRDRQVLRVGDLSDAERAATEMDPRHDHLNAGLEPGAALSETPPAKRTPAEAAARILAHRPLRRLPEGETIRSMIEHGRA